MHGKLKSNNDKIEKIAEYILALSEAHKAKLEGFMLFRLVFIIPLSGELCTPATSKINACPPLTSNRQGTNNG